MTNDLHDGLRARGVVNRPVGERRNSDDVRRGSPCDLFYKVRMHTLDRSSK